MSKQPPEELKLDDVVKNIELVLLRDTWMGRQIFRREGKGGKAMRWKPKVGEIYWYVDTFQMDCSPMRRSNDNFDLTMYRFGNCFRTIKEAEQAAVKVRKLLLSLQKEK